MTTRAQLQAAVEKAARKCALVREFPDPMNDEELTTVVETLIAFTKKALSAPTTRWDAGDWRMPCSMSTEEYDRREAEADELAGAVVAIIKLDEGK